MKPSSFTERKMGLDKNVWVVMISVMFLSLGLVSYNYITDINSPCIPLSITINALPTLKETIHFENEPLIFKVASAAGKKIVWNFGDKTDVEEGFMVTHVFRKEGRFDVIATFNGKCENIAKVNIKKLVKVHQDLSNISISEKIMGNDFPTVGKEEAYTYGAAASSYEWTIKNSTNFATQTSPNATFKFSFPGTYTLQLVLDNDPGKKGFKEITVINPVNSSDAANGGPKKDLSASIPNLLPPLPDIRKKVPKLIADDKSAEKVAEKAPEKPVTEPIAEVAAPTRKILNVNDEQFKSRLEELVEGQLEADFFDRYLFYGGKTMVRVNDEKMLKNFSAFCDEVRGKKVSIESVKLQREENNTIQQIKVKYSKKKRFGIF